MTLYRPTTVDAFAYVPQASNGRRQHSNYSGWHCYHFSVINTSVGLSSTTKLASPHDIVFAHYAVETYLHFLIVCLNRGARAPLPTCWYKTISTPVVDFRRAAPLLIIVSRARARHHGVTFHQVDQQCRTEICHVAVGTSLVGGVHYAIACGK